MKSINNNNSAALGVKVLFGLYGILLVNGVLIRMLCLVGYIPNFGIACDVFDIEKFIFYLVALVYLIWYYLLMQNFARFTEENSKKLKWINWFVPILNIFLPYQDLNNILKEYSSKVNVNEKINYLLEIWIASFLLWHLFQVYIFFNSPLFPEDYEIFIRCAHTYNIFNSILELVGLYTMYRVVSHINKLELEYIDNKAKMDVIDHLIDE